MYKNFLTWILSGALFVGLMGVAVSCQDYDNDIKDLQNQITALQSTVADLQSAIDSGKVITTVAEDNGGVRITFSDGSSVYISNGADGKDGADGKNGADGKDGTNGTNGTDGKDADVWTIGADGYWYVNGELFTDTNWPNGVPATGTSGSTGETGPQGEPGADGADGLTIAMMPCPDNDGWFNLVQLTYNDETETWEQEIVFNHYYQFAVPADENDDNTLYAILDGNTLTLYNVREVDEDGNVTYTDYTIKVGSELGSVAFVPDYIDSATGYPTTAPFVSMDKYLDEDKVDDDGYFIAQDSLGISNTVGLVYRLNPSNAYVEDAVYEFINRNVQVRSGSTVDGDNSGLLTIENTVHNGETVTVTASVNPDAFSETGYDFAALRVWVGTDQVVTSDYIVVKNEDTDATPVIVDKAQTPKGTEEGKGVEFNARTKGINESQTENDVFIHEFVTEPAYDDTTEEWTGANIAFPYNEELDLAEYVGLYAYAALDYVESLGVEPTFVYTLPTSFTVGGEEQQASVVLEDSVVTAANGTFSVNKFPVVRVDAYIDGYMVATSYILLQVTGVAIDPVWFPLNGFKVEDEDDIETNSAGDDDSVTSTGSNHTIASYRLLNGNAQGSVQTYFLNLTGAEFLADIETLGFGTLDEFWTYYDKEYFYTITPYDIEDVESCEVADPAKADWTDMEFYYNGGGVGANPGDGSLSYLHSSPAEFWFGTNVAAEDEDLFFRVGVDYGVLTQHSHTDVTCGVCGGHGAMYLVTLSFKSKDDNVTPDVCFNAFVHIYDACEPLELSPAYKIPDPTEYGLDADANAVLVKGTTMNVGEDILGGWDQEFSKNVVGLAFDWAEAYEDTEGNSLVNPEYNNGEGGLITKDSPTVSMTISLDDDYYVFNMIAGLELANGEICPGISYWIVFAHHFTAKEFELTANEPYDYLLDMNTMFTTGRHADLRPYVGVIEVNSGDDILTWDATNTVFVLSDLATETYGLTDELITVTYAIDEEAKDYPALETFFGTDEVLTIDQDGYVDFKYSSIANTYYFDVIATVGLGEYGTVSCTIPCRLH